MGLDEVKAAIEQLPHTDLTPLAIWLNSHELPRREKLEVKLEGMTEILAETATGIITPEQVESEDTPVSVDDIPDWVNPGTDHKRMYHPNSIVRHNGKLWVSMLPRINEYEPGGIGIHSTIWAEYVLPEPEPEPEAPDEGVTAPDVEQQPEAPAVPQWVQPTGGHDAYKIGDRVAYNGAVWESLINANSWSPDDYPAGWKKV